MARYKIISLGINKKTETNVFFEVEICIRSGFFRKESLTKLKGFAKIGYSTMIYDLHSGQYISQIYGYDISNAIEGIIDKEIN